MSERGQKAYDYFMQGYNCAQAVLLAFSDLTGLDEKTAALVASGFGAGIGKTRNVCGTVTGMIMAADLINGYENPKDSNAKETALVMPSLESDNVPSKSNKNNFLFIDYS